MQYCSSYTSPPPARGPRPAGLRRPLNSPLCTVYMLSCHGVRPDGVVLDDGVYTCVGASSLAAQSSTSLTPGALPSPSPSSSAPQDDGGSMCFPVDAQLSVALCAQSARVIEQSPDTLLSKRGGTISQGLVPVFKAPERDPMIAYDCFDGSSHGPFLCSFFRARFRCTHDVYKAFRSKEYLARDWGMRASSTVRFETRVHVNAKLNRRLLEARESGCGFSCTVRIYPSGRLDVEAISLSTARMVCCRFAQTFCHAENLP